MSGESLTPQETNYLNDRHFFSALALLKIEMARGSEILRKIFQRTPGIFIADGSMIQKESPLQALHRYYTEANEALNMRSIALPDFD